MFINFSLIYKITVSLLFFLLYVGYIYFRRKNLESAQKRKTFLYLILIQMGAFLLILLVEYNSSNPKLMAGGALLNLALTITIIISRIKYHKNSCHRCGAKVGIKEMLFVEIPYCKSCKEHPGTTHNHNNTNGEIPEIPSQLSFIDWDKWEYIEHAVLCFIKKDNKIILIHKKRGMGAGKINAPGGRIEEGETPLDAAIRETEEEIGVTPQNLKLLADLHFIFKDGYSLRGYAFFADDYTGTLAKTVEADPFEVLEKDIPYNKMWADDKEWLPIALEGKKIVAKFIFNGEKIIDREIEVKK